MHFAGIDLPIDLVQTHADGDVVFFVGAGASVSPPTSLPLFGKLAQQVADIARRPCSKSDLENPDVFLGSLASHHGVEVNDLVAQELRRATAPNQMHRALAILSSASAPARIVTTNYDHFITKALEEEGVSHEVHLAPALPIGDDFEGIVHIHGRLGQPTSRLVVTDSDFGRAYLSQAWATTFLRSLFARFTVCFVGYSHKDRMMEYLARGLPTQSRPRYAFTDDPLSPQWSLLNIIPIGYPPSEHNTLTTALVAWGNWAQSTPLQRAQQIRTILQGTPPADPDEQDFLLHAISDPILAREIYDRATTTDWFRWLVEQPAFSSLFGGSDGIDDELVRNLANWFADCATIPEMSQTALRIALGNSEEPHTLLVQKVLARIARNEFSDENLSPWLRWCMDACATNAASETNQWLGQVWISDVSLSEYDTMSLLSLLTSLRRQPLRTSLVDRPDFTLTTEEFILKEGLEKRFGDRPSAPQACVILIWASNFFAQANFTLRSNRDSFDPWSYSRSAIEDHEQNSYTLYESVDAIITLTRTALEALLEEDQSLASAYIFIWMQSQAVILNRLAIHGLRLKTSVTDAAKIDIVLARGWLFDIELQHEVLALLASSWPSLDSNERTPLLEALAQGPEGRDPEYEDLNQRLIYDRMHWLATHDRDSRLDSAILEIQDSFPDWKPRDHADFSTWMSNATWSTAEEEYPAQPADFHRQLGEDIDTALAIIKENPNDENFRRSRGRNTLVSITVSQWPDDGITLWRHISTADHLATSVINGWRDAELSIAQTERILGLLADTRSEDIGSAVAGLLGPRASNQTQGTDWPKFAPARTLARAVWMAVRNVLPRTSSDDLLTGALNNPGGKLADFWIEAASLDARQDTELKMLPDEIRDALEEMIAPNAQGKFAIAMLMTQLRFLHTLDSTWTKRHLFPLLGIGTQASAESDGYWTVVLRAGQLDESLLEAGLRDALVTCTSRATDVPALMHSLPKALAHIVVRSPMDDATRLNWMSDLAAHGDDTLLAEWLHSIASSTSKLETASYQRLWTRWMKPYLTDRAAGRPRKLTNSETQAVLQLIASLSDPTEIASGTQVLIEAKTGLSSQRRLVRFPLTTDILAKNPVAWAALLTSILRYTTSLSMWDIHIVQATSRLETLGAAADDIDAIRDRMYELGATLDSEPEQ